MLTDVLGGVWSGDWGVSCISAWEKILGDVLGEARGGACDGVSRDVLDGVSRDDPGCESRDVPGCGSRDVPGCESRDVPGCESRDVPGCESRDRVSGGSWAGGFTLMRLVSLINPQHPLTQCVLSIQHPQHLSKNPTITLYSITRAQQFITYINSCILLST